MRIKQKQRSGFTLTELLVVIFIMTIVLGISAISLTQNNTAQGLETASSTLQSLISEARSRAMSGNTITRLAVNNAPADPGYRKEIAIAKESVDPATGNAIWVTDSRAITLPDGVFLDPNLTLTGLTINGDTMQNSEVMFGNEAMTDFYIEFNRLGICKHDTDPAGTEGAILYLVKGNPNTVANSADAPREAIVIWKNGSTTAIKDSTRIE